MLPGYFVLFGIAMQACGQATYIADTIRGRTRPNRATWFLWGLIPLVAFSAQLDDGVGMQSLLTLTASLGPMAIFAASFINRNAVWQLRTLDIVCGALSIVGLVLWWITRTGEVAIIFAIVADSLAAIPTILKAYRNPETEHPYVYWLAATSAAITLLTVDHWNLSHYGFPIYLLVSCVIIAVPITLARARRTTTKPAQPS